MGGGGHTVTVCGVGLWGRSEGGREGERLERERERKRERERERGGGRKSVDSVTTVATKANTILG